MDHFCISIVLMYNTVTFGDRGGLTEEFCFVLREYLFCCPVFPLDDKAVLNMRQSVLGELL